MRYTCPLSSSDEMVADWVQADSAPTAECQAGNRVYPLVREVHQNGTDAGTCACTSFGVMKCLPSAIIAGIEKGGTGELKVRGAGPSTPGRL